MRLLNIVFGALMILFLVLYIQSGGGRRGEAAGAGAASPAAGRGAADEEYVFIGVQTSNPYWIDHQRAFQDRGRLLGVKATFTGPAGSDIRDQVTSLENAVARHARGIMICPADPDALTPAINRAVEAGIPVVTSDSDAPNSKRYCFIGTGNYQAGVEGGKILAKLLDGKGKVAFLTIPGQWNLNERVRGYKDVLQSHPGIGFGPEANDDGDSAKGAAAAKNILQAHPDLAAFACVDAAGGAGAAVAVREAGRPGAVKIVAMDRNEQTLDEMDKGLIQATLVQRTYTMATLGMTMMYELNHGGFKLGKDWTKTGSDPLPKLIDTGVVVVTPETAKLFRSAGP